jgi:hypothetical protein
MAEINCPVCNTHIKTEAFSDWVKRWDESQWNSPEWRQFLIGEIEDFYATRDKLNKIEMLYEAQAEYVKTLERQIELLQKTLDLAEKFTPRPLVIPGVSEVIK